MQRVNVGSRSSGFLQFALFHMLYKKDHSPADTNGIEIRHDRRP